MMSTSSAMIGCNVSYQRLPASLPCPAPCRLHHRLSSCRRSHAPSRARSVRLVCNAVVARAPHDQAVPPAKRTVVSTTRCARCLPFATHLHIHIRYEGGVSIELSTVGSRLEVDIWAEPAKRRVLHWAVNAWELPPQSCWPPNTQQADNKACQTEFTNGNHVKIVFHEHDCPQRVVFVIKELEPEENWVNNGGVDYGVQLKAPSLSDITTKVLDAEATYSNWGLFNRFCLANELLDGASAAGPEGMGFIYTWLRLSAIRQLDWYRNSNYQSKDIAHVQKVVTQRAAEKASGADDPLVRLLARLTVSLLPRGGGDGDAIRMGILHIMRDNGIKEGHRPGLEERFLEQWHQKLHTNTSPEDVTICQAYLNFLHSGNIDDYWAHLEGNNVTREALATMDHPITAEPMHLPYLIDPIKHFMWVLKTTHSGTDLDVSMEMAKGFMDEELRWQLFDLLAHRDEWWAPGKVVELRHRLKQYWKMPGSSRDLLMLDIALDGWFRVCVERMEKSKLSGDDLIELVTLVLDNASIACESEELDQCLALWRRLKDEPRWESDWVLKALAASQRTALSLSAHCDGIYNVVQPAAEAFEARCGIDNRYILNFGEEVVRGQSVFVLGQLLRYLEPLVRKMGGVSTWLVVSGASAKGYVVECPSLADVQGMRFNKPTVILTNEVGGNEDIPLGVTAVLSQSPTDVLSHVAIRARCQGVLLAACFDDAEFEMLRQLRELDVSLHVTSTGSIAAQLIDPTDSVLLRASNAATMAGVNPEGRIQLPAVRTSTSWAVRDVLAEPGTVGAKASNLVALASALPEWIHVPASVCLPFGTFERVIAHPSNSQTTWTLEKLLKELEEYSTDSGVPPTLAAIRDLVTTFLKAPDELRGELTYTAAACGLATQQELQDEATWAKLWKAVCRVWASKWNDRAWLSRQANGIRDEELVMSCLLQQVVPADYAFVLHTANPVTGQRGEVFGEMVVGLGETLVGNHPGRPLTFSTPAGQSPQVLTYPSKRVGLFAPPTASLIVRSDSNGEDLETFAGAGLYDSVLVDKAVTGVLDYSQEPLLWEGALRDALLAETAALGVEIEAAFGGVPQDIEGVWTAGHYTVVQSRPQVLPA